jgi:hypothetical protein
MNLLYFLSFTIILCFKNKYMLNPKEIKLLPSVKKAPKAQRK